MPGSCTNVLRFVFPPICGLQLFTRISSCFLTLTLKYSESIVIVNKSSVEVLVEISVLDPLSSKRVCLQNISVCMSVYRAGDRNT